MSITKQSKNIMVRLAAALNEEDVSDGMAALYMTVCITADNLVSQLDDKEEIRGVLKATQLSCDDVIDSVKEMIEKRIGVLEDEIRYNKKEIGIP